jgi:hypothetical protein
MLLALLDRKNGRLNQKAISQWESTFSTVSSRDQRRMFEELLEQQQDGYVLKYGGVDHAFLQSFPSVVEESKAYWEKVLKELPALMESEKRRGKGTEKGAGRMAAMSHPLVRETDEKKQHVIREVEMALKQQGMTVSRLRKNLQPKFKEFQIDDRYVEDILRSQQVKAAQLRHLWLLEKTHKETHDKFRRVVHNCFQHRDSVTKLDVVEAYEDTYPDEPPCTLTDFCVRFFIREVAERQSDGSWLLRELPKQELF